MSEKENTNISIYSNNQHGALHPNQLQNPHNIPGFAMIRQHKELKFKKGKSQLFFDDVTEFIDPTTVSLKLNDNDQNKISIIDQNYQFDLVDNNKLLQKYIGESITINHNLGDTSVNTTGTLLSTQGGLIIKQGNETIKTINAWNHITFNALPEGLLTRPTLVWQIDSQLSGLHPVTVSYQSQGMTWWSDYNITLNESDSGCYMDLSAWVSIVNKSGGDFKNSQLKLIAGDVNRTTQQPQNIRATGAKQFAESDMTSEALFEYHMYRLPHWVDLPNHSTKQVPLINPINNIQCKKILTYNATNLDQINYHKPITHSNYYRQNKGHVTASLHFENSPKNQLGIPLPAGRVRVNVSDAKDGSLEFIGEDSIDHTPKNERLELKLGQSFDVTGNRKQTDFTAEKSGLKETFEIELSNQKPHETTVQVIEPMYRWSNWEVSSSTHKYKKTQSDRINFEIKLPPESKETIKYTVQYHWPQQ
ncbi:DUF4139 domain-containing protein [Marinicella rhabdoformis]|uniref:DUF4139 domain-containing protein n=1 Tax=Marinicella rhabdoformis TaxID=2580566 RepID=UPI0015D00238|nr:DUF4139 domain-containing protein [Marinicella rhabdoformis]